MYGSTPRTPIKRRVLTPHTPGKVRKVNCPHRAECLAGTLPALECWHDVVRVVLRAPPPLGSVSQRCQKGSGALQQCQGRRNGARLRALLSVGVVGLVGVPRSWRAPCSWCFQWLSWCGTAPASSPLTSCSAFPQLNGTSISSATPNSTVRSAFGATLYHSPTSRLPPSGGKVRALLGRLCLQGAGEPCCAVLLHLPPLPSSGGIQAACWSQPHLGSCTVGGMSVGPAQPGGKGGWAAFRKTPSSPDFWWVSGPSLKLGEGGKIFIP